MPDPSPIVPSNSLVWSFAPDGQGNDPRRIGGNRPVPAEAVKRDAVAVEVERSVDLDVSTVRAAGDRGRIGHLQHARADGRVGVIAVSAPPRVRTPEPTFVSASEPEPSSIVPSNWLVWSLSPTVRVTAPGTPVVTVPDPLRPLSVTPWPLRSSVPSTSTLP